MPPHFLAYEKVFRTKRCNLSNEWNSFYCFERFLEQNLSSREVLCFLRTPWHYWVHRSKLSHHSDAVEPVFRTNWAELPTGEPFSDPSHMVDERAKSRWERRRPGDCRVVMNFHFPGKVVLSPEERLNPAGEMALPESEQWLSETTISTLCKRKNSCRMV